MGHSLGQGTIQKFCFSLVLAIAAFSLSASAKGSDCGSILGDYSEIGKLSSEQLSQVKKEFKHNNKYTKQVEAGEIKDQCAWGACWSFSLATTLNGLALAKTGEAVDISPHYLVALQIVSRGIMEIPRYGRQHSQGEYLPYALEMAKTYGLVPTESWTPRVNILDRAIADRFHFYVNHIVQKFQLTYFELNQTLGQFQMRDVRSLTPEDLKIIQDVEQAKVALIELAQQELWALVESFMGPIPEQFVYKGQKTDPITFAKEHMGLDDVALVSASPKLTRRPVPEGFFGNSHHGTYRGKKDLVEVEVPMETLEQMIVNEIDNNRPVWFALNWERAFVDSKTGIMSLEAFHSPFKDLKIDRSYVDTFDAAGGHAVVIVGYEMGADGRVVKFKIQNSWGEKSGDNGYYHMYRDYFEAFASEVAAITTKEKAKRIKAAKKNEADLKRELKKL